MCQCRQSITAAGLSRPEAIESINTYLETFSTDSEVQREHRGIPLNLWVSEGVA